MPSAFDLLDAGQPAVDDVPVLDTPSQFGRGLRSGFAGAQSQLHALAGTAGEALGANEFAHGQYDDAAARQQEAEAMAPRVSSYKDVHGIRDAFDYVSGLAGQSLPQSAAVMAGGVAGGLVAGPGGAIAGATLAGTPFEAGDIAQRQQVDPAAASEDASLRLGKALVGGAASSAVQSALPVMAAGKVVGTAAKKGLRQALHEGITHLPGSMALEGGTEAGGEAIKQVVTNPDAPMNTDALLEAGIGGAAAGVPLHAAGVVGDVAHAGMAAPGNVLARGAEAVKGATEKVGDAVAPKVADPVDNLRGIYDAGKAKAKDFWQAAADGTDAAAAWAKGKGLTPEQIKEKLPEADAERVGTISDWTKEQLAAGGLTPERAAFLQDKLATITEPASQQAVAVFKRGMDAAGEVGSKAKELLDTFMEGRKAPEAKQSADFGGVDATIAQHVMPVLQEMHPGFESDPEATNRVAEGVRMAMHVFAEGGREAASSTRVAKLIDIFGDKTAEVLDRVQSALQSVPTSKRENFYSALNEIKRQQKDSDKVLGLMQRSLAPELQDTVKMPDLHRELKVLREWVANTDAPTEETAFKGDQVLKDMQTRYGDKAEAILKALEAEHEKKSKVDNVVNEEDAKANGLQGVDATELGDSIEYGREVKPSAETVAKAKAAGEEVPKAFRTLDLHPDLDPNGDKGQATQALVKATAENPSRTARFVSAKELGDAHPGVQHTLKRLAADFMEAGKTPEQAQALAKKSLEHYGMVVADGKSQPGTIDRSNVKQVMVGKGAKDVPRSHYDQPSVFKVDGKAFDARAITKEMQRQFAGQDDVTDKSAIHRNARMFMEGVAALQDHLGTKVDLPDTLVIDGKGTTVADAKKLGFTPDRRADEMAEKRVQALKDRYAKMAEGVTNPEEVHALRTELADKIAEERDRAMNFDPREDLTTDATERDADPFNDSTVTLGNKTEPVNRNADGSARLVPNTSEADKAAAAERMKPADKAALDKLMSALASKAETAAGHAIVARGQELLANVDVINRSGQRALTSMLQKGKRLSDIASTINALHEKYQGQFKPVAKDTSKTAPVEKVKPVEPAKAKPTEKPKGKFDVDKMVEKDDFAAVTDDAKADAFLKEAAERLRDLKAMGDERTDAQDVAYYHLRDLFEHTSDLGSFYEGLDTGSKDLEVRKQLAKAVPEVAALVRPKADEKVKYSMDATRIHEESGNEGFGATHDSPIRHEGKFDWRAHIGKGEGNAVFGAGTYLSTADGVHKSYKKQFTAKTRSTNTDPVHAALDDVVRDEPHLSFKDQKRLASILLAEGNADRIFSNVEKLSDQIGHPFEFLDVEDDPSLHANEKALKDIKKITGEYIFDEQGMATFKHLDPAALDKLVDIARKFDMKDVARELEFSRDLAKHQERLEAMTKAPAPTRSPTYEVSVNIKADQLLDWAKDISEQSTSVQKALEKLGIKSDPRTKLEWDRDEPGLWRGFAEVPGDGFREFEIRNDHDLYTVVRITAKGEKDLGQYTSLQEAKSVAQTEVGGAVTGGDAYRKLERKFGSQRGASDALQAEGILGHHYPSSGQMDSKHPNYVIYDDSKITTNYVHFSAENTDPNAAVSPAQRAQIRSYINDVLGPQVKTALANILHAGEYREAHDLIRISVHALNPMSVAYHESLHAFMAKLMEQGNGRVAQVLRDVAMSTNVQEQLRNTFANQPSVLRQLSDPEESAAYMYQLWKQGQLTVGPAAKSIFGRIADAIRKALGVWSKDERAEEIMRYFSSGEFKRNAGRPNEVTRALIESGKNPAIERARELARPLTDFAEMVGSAGSERLRSTGIPALVEMSKLMKATGREARDDKGFIPTAREARARTMNAFAAAMKDARDEHVADAMKALQTRSGAATPEGRLIVRQVKTLLQQQLRYMQQAGVETAGIMPDPDYFPRKYDASYISRHQDAFTTVLENHGIDTATAKGITQRLMGNNGADPLFEINRPGMVNLKQRKLGDIPDAMLEPFMVKNLWEVMDSYVSQASRRAEWARRFGDRADSMDTFLHAARAQGATDKQIKLADNYIKAVDGTLGDDLSPAARRMMGNALVYENVRLLPLAIFSSVIDPLGIVVRGGTVGDAWTTFKRGVGDLPRAWKKTYTTDGAEQMAETLGVIDSAILGHDTSSLYMQGMASDTAKKINDSFFRWNFMDGFNRSMRVGATQAAIKFLERNADGRASAHSVRWLSELGLTPADLAGGVDPYAPKVRAAINQWVDGAILRPDAADKPVWMNDPHYMLISHLKQFAYAFQETILKRVAHEARAGNYSPAWALASYVPVMVASDMVKGILQGGGDVPQWKRGWGPGDYIESGVERAGLFGAGQFAVDAAKDVSRGDLFPGSLTGPAIDQLKEAVLTITGREKPVTFAEHSLPAHSLYMGFVDKANTHADPTFAE